MIEELNLETIKKDLGQLIVMWAEEKKILLPGETLEIDVRVVSPPKVRIEIISSTLVDGAISLVAAIFCVHPEQIAIESIADLRTGLQKTLGLLNRRQVEILDMVYGLNQPPVLRRKDQASALGISGSRILQIERKALRMIRHPTRIKILQELVRIKE